MTAFPLGVLSALAATCAVASAYGAITDPDRAREPMRVIVLWAFAIAFAGMSAGLAWSAA
jgi:hypothetical protein